MESKRTVEMGEEHRHRLDDDIMFEVEEAGERKMLSRYGIWLLVELCTPKEDIPIVSHLFELLHIMPYIVNILVPNHTWKDFCMSSSIEIDLRCYTALTRLHISISVYIVLNIILCLFLHNCLHWLLHDVTKNCFSGKGGISADIYYITIWSMDWICTLQEILGRLLGMLFQWFDATAYLPDGN